jgi:hypothetical protein
MANKYYVRTRSNKFFFDVTGTTARVHAPPFYSRVQGRKSVLPSTGSLECIRIPLRNRDRLLSMMETNDDSEIIILDDDEDAKNHDEKAFTEVTCPICFELLWSDAAGVTECGHLFHQSCWNTWDGRSNGRRNNGGTKCPLCQTRTHKFITIFGIDSTNFGNMSRSSTSSQSIRAADDRVRELEAKLVQMEEEKSSLTTCLKDVEIKVGQLEQNVFQLSLGETKWKSQLQKAENKIEALQGDLKGYEERMAKMKQTMEENRCSPEIMKLHKNYTKVQAELCKLRDTNRSLQEQLNVLTHRSTMTTTNKVRVPVSNMASSVPSKGLVASNISSDRSNNYFTRTDNDNHHNTRVPTDTVITTQNPKGLHHGILENTILGSSIKLSSSSSHHNTTLTGKPPAATVPSASIVANSSSSSKLKKSTSTALDALSYTNKRKKLTETLPLQNLQGFQKDHQVAPKPRVATKSAPPKDPNAPKRARGSYVCFTFEMRPKIMEEYPGIKFVEMGSILGERWRNLPPEEKKRYEDMAAQDKAR